MPPYTTVCLNFPRLYHRYTAFEGNRIYSRLHHRRRLFIEPPVHKVISLILILNKTVSLYFADFGIYIENQYQSV